MYEGVYLYSTINSSEGICRQSNIVTIRRSVVVGHCNDKQQWVLERHDASTERTLALFCFICRLENIILFVWKIRS